MIKKKKLLKGQVVVEYILVIVAIVGLALAAYTALKSRMKKPLQTFKEKVEKDSADAGKPRDSYYNKIEYKTNEPN